MLSYLHSITSRRQAYRNPCSQMAHRFATDCRCIPYHGHGTRPDTTRHRRPTYFNCSKVCLSHASCCPSSCHHNSLHPGSKICPCRFSFHFSCILRTCCPLHTAQSRIPALPRQTPTTKAPPGSLSCYDYLPFFCLVLHCPSLALPSWPPAQASSQGMSWPCRIPWRGGWSAPLDWSYSKDCQRI